jgi:glutathione S-transferase
VTSRAQQRLLKLTQRSLPLDSIQRQAAKEGVKNLLDSEATAIADDLEAALHDLPDALTRMEAALAKPQVRENEISANVNVERESRTAVLFDDDQPFSRNVAEILESIGCTVRRPRYSEQALQELKELARPAMVLMDVTRADLDGFEVLSALKTAFPNIATIAMTGSAELERDAARCRAIGATFLQKNLPAAALAVQLQGVAALVEAHSKLEAAAKTAADDLDAIRANIEVIQRSVEVLTTTDAPMRAPPIYPHRHSAGGRLKLYMHPVSMTSLPVRLFIAENKIPCEEQIVDLMTGENYREPYASINPNKIVPVLEDGDLRLTEASAILKYLAERIGSPAYPTDLRQRAKVNEVMDWVNTNFYREFGYGMAYPAIFPHHKGPTGIVEMGTIAWGAKRAHNWLSVLDKHWLGTSKYLCGNQITVADYFSVCLITLGELLRIDFTPYPNVQRWMVTMKLLESWPRMDAQSRAFTSAASYAPFVGV